MKQNLKKIATLAFAAVLMLSVVPTGATADTSTYTAPYSTVRIGLYTYKSDGAPNQKSFPSANLQNVHGLGSGYELGYFDTDRNFHSLGVFITDTEEITMMMDRTMVYNSGSNSYSEGSDGSVVVGCVHIRLPEKYTDYASAKAAADKYKNSFVRYENGSFIALVGQYVSTKDANAAISELNIKGTADSGTSNTVTVVKSRTNTILFEYDCGTESSLAVKPIAPDGVKAQTWFKDCMYYGAFSYLRNTGGSLTVVNYVDVEDYVKGVVPYEMNASWPREALKAQAITARTFLMASINKHRASGFDICNTTDCQAYHGTDRANANSDAAVDETASQYLTYNGAICSTNYYSSNGGASENSENVWTQALPYMRGKEDPYEKNIAGIASSYYWTKTFTPASLAQRLRDKGYTCSDIVNIKMTFTEMGNVLSITFTDKNNTSFTVSKEKVRTVPGVRSPRYTVNGLGPANKEMVFVNGGATLEDGLNGAYAVGSGGTGKLASGDVYAITGTGTVEKVSPSAASSSKGVGVNSSGLFVFSGSGYGHNVGMSQWGAYSMAKYYNKTAVDILTFYYTGTKVVTSTRKEPVYYQPGTSQTKPDDSADADESIDLPVNTVIDTTVPEKKPEAPDEGGTGPDASE